VVVKVNIQRHGLSRVDGFATGRRRLGPAKHLRNALYDAPPADRLAGWRVVRPSIAERGFVVFFATCGVTLYSRRSATKLATS